MRALHKRREERFQTAQEMALALERYAFASEGFSPLQLATYMKGLFDTEYAQWKKTVSSALEMESNSPGRLQSGTRFPVIQRPDLPTRGPTVALRKAGHSSIDTAIVGDPTSDSRIAAESISGAPTRRDRMWVYGGLAAVVAICATGALVLSQPRLGSTVRPAAPIPPRVMLATPPTPAPPAPPPPAAQVAAPAAPTAAPAAPAPAAGEAAETPPPSGAAEGGEPAGTAAGRAAADDPRGARASGSGKSRGHSSRGSGRPRGRGRGDGESDEAAPAVDRPPPVLQDHRPNPFD
jgi:hypothetical protein